MSEGNKPEKKFRAGAISATIWKNHNKEKDTDYYTVSVERNYKKDDDWKSTTSLRVHDIPNAQLLLAKVYEYLLFKEISLTNGGSAKEEDVIDEEDL